jgi:imidazolonepropionase-like amidohydrolase
MLTLRILHFLLLLGIAVPGWSQSQPIIIENVRVFQPLKQRFSDPVQVWVEGSSIRSVSTTALTKPDDAKVIDGTGKTLIPGLIDVHVHLVFGSMSMADMMTPNLSEAAILEKAAIQSREMLMRGFTAVRDVGGPIFPLKAAIDEGVLQGPRIWPSGATISQTSGHGDFRLPSERSRRYFGRVSRAELFNATFIADGRDEVLTAVRENLRGGASQIKLMAGGGTSSAYDPVDVTQYTLDEMKAAVEAAEDWGTYVTVHAYTPRAIQRAVEAGVKCVEHGQMLDKTTLKLLARKKVWLSLQVLIASTEQMDPLRVEKRKPVIEGQAKVWPLAKKLKVPLAWGTDFLFEPELNALQNEYLLKLLEWFTPAEILKMVTYDNAQVLALSGLRSPYKGRLGIIENGALADLILVNGNPIEQPELLMQPDEQFLLIMKDGKIYKEKSP